MKKRDVQDKINDLNIEAVAVLYNITFLTIFRNPHLSIPLSPLRYSQISAGESRPHIDQSESGIQQPIGCGLAKCLATIDRRDYGDQYRDVGCF